MNITQKTLKNELNTLFINNKGASSGSVQIWFRAGSSLEKKENEGIAHFLEHMFFKGTKKRPGSKIAHEVESFGGEINAFTSFDYTCYYINTPNEHLGKTVEILMDMVSNPLFSESELTPEREVVLEEYKRSQDNPNNYNFQNIQKSCFQKGYAHPILGTPKTISKFSRQQLTQFRNDHYNTSNAMLVVAGDFPELKITKQIEKFKMPKGKQSLFPKFSLKKKHQVNIHNKQVKQASLTLAIEAPKYLSKSSATEDLAINCLASGETSRLFKELVLEKSVATYVSGSTMFFSDGGIHLIKAVFPEKNTNKILQSFMKVFKEVGKAGFKNAELSKIKNQYIASKIYEQEALEGIAFSLGHGFAQNGNINCEDDFIKLLEKVTLTQSNKSFKDIFSRPIHCTLQLPEGVKKDKYQNKINAFSKKVSDNFINKKEKIKKEVLASSYDPALTKKTITNGVTFLHRYNPTAPTFVLHSYIKGGLYDETKENNGLYHLLAQSLTYGYQGVSYEELKNDLASKSASLSGFAGKNAFGLTSHGQTKDFKSLCSHFMNTLRNPSFPQKYIEHEKTITTRVLDNHSEDPVKQCFKAFNEAIFKDHHYGYNIIGDSESLKNLNQKAVKNRHAEDINQKEILITYCGSQSFDEVYPEILKYLSDFPKRKKIKTKRYQFPKYQAKNIDLQFQREQTQIFMGFPAFAITQKEKTFLTILSSHLSGQSSELFVDVRDKKGLCYAVQPVHFSALEAGYWGIYIGAGADKKDQAIEAINHIFTKLKTKGFTKSQLKRVKTMIKGQQQINIQTHNDYASLYSVPLLHGLGLDFPHQQLEKIEQVNLEEFNQFLTSYFNNKPIVVTAGPTL